MAQVVVEHGSQSSGAVSGIGGEIQGIFSWFAHYWWVILIVLIFFGVAILLIWLLWKSGIDEKRKDFMYIYFERSLDACFMNRRKHWVRKKRRWWLLLFGVPTAAVGAIIYLFLLRGGSWLALIFTILFCFALWLIPIFAAIKDYSMKVIDIERNVIGHYRGHCKRMDGYIYLLLCVGRKWLFLDDNLILRLPENVLTIKTVELKDSEGSTIEKTIDIDKIEITSYIWNERDNYIFIPCIALVKEDTYYYSATLIEEGKILDLRQKIANSFHLMTGIQIAEQTYSQIGKITNNAVDSNLGVVADKKRPEKQKDVSSGDTAN